MTSKAVFVRRAVSIAAAILVHAVLLSRADIPALTNAQSANAAGESYPVIKITDIGEAPSALAPLPAEECGTETAAAGPAAETITAVDNAALDEGVGDFLPAHLVSQLPRFSEEELLKRVFYPPIAQKDGIEGIVYLEIFVDQTGAVQNITVLKEEPEGRGFGGAAAAAFRGLRGSPALANGKPAAVRYRYPVRFSLRKG